MAQQSLANFDLNLGKQYDPLAGLGIAKSLPDVNTGAGSFQTMGDYMPKMDYSLGEMSLAGGNPGMFGNFNPNSASKGMDWGGAFKNFSLGAEGVLSLADAYANYQKLGILKDQQHMAEQNFANINNDRRAQDKSRTNAIAQLDGNRKFNPDGTTTTGYNQSVDANTIKYQG